MTATREGRGLAGTAVFPDYYHGPLAPEAPSPTTAPTPPQRRPRLPRSVYPAIAERARHESLRDLAAEYGVSHETIRAVVRRVGAAGRAGIALAADEAAGLARVTGVNWLKQWRSVATRYEQRATNYRALVVLAALLLWRGW